MVRDEKLPNALYALNGILVIARAMTYSSRPKEEIADVLDVAEYLPRLLAEPEDRTEQFRAFLLALAAKSQDFQIVVDRFDCKAPTRW